MRFSLAIIVLCQLLFSLFQATSGTILFAELTGAAVSVPVNTTYKGLAVAYYSNVTRILNITVMHNISAVFAQVQYTNYTFLSPGVPAPPITTTLFPFINTTSPIAMNGINVTADQEKLLLNNTFFFLVHTYAHINGELRGTLRPNKFNGTIEYAAVQKPSENNTYLGVTYFSYNCTGLVARIRFVHNLNQSITIQLYGITNASLHAPPVPVPNDTLSTEEKHKKGGKHQVQRGKKNSKDGSKSSPTSTPTVVLPPYVSLYNLTANATDNVVNTTITFPSSVNFTLFVGGIIFMKVLDATNTTVLLSGFLNQTDKESCKYTKLAPLSDGQEAAIGGFCAIVFVMLLLGLARKIYAVAKKRKDKKASKYDGVTKM